MSEPILDDEGRPEPPFSAPEVPTLLGFLDYQRATLAWKTRGLTTEQLRQPLSPTSMTLGGILTHMAWVESFWFIVTVGARAPEEPWRTMDFDADDDADWHLANELDGDAVRVLWEENVERSRSQVAGMLEQHGDAALDHEADAWGGNERVSLRWVLTHMIEEYARHNGHADLLREAIDGSVGE